MHNVVGLTAHRVSIALVAGRVCSFQHRKAVVAPKHNKARAICAVKLSACFGLCQCGIDSFRELVRIQLATDILMRRQVPCIIFKCADFLRDSRDNCIVTHGMDIICSKHNSTCLAVYAGYCAYRTRTWSRPQLTVFVFSDRLRHGFRFCFWCVVLFLDFVSQILRKLTYIFLQMTNIFQRGSIVIRHIINK